MIKHKLFGAVCLITSLGLVVSAPAAIVTFSGGDPGANVGDPHPVSDATALTFDTAAVCLDRDTSLPSSPRRWAASAAWWLHQE